MSKPSREKITALCEKCSLEELKLIHSDISTLLLDKVEKRQQELEKESENLSKLKTEIGSK